MGSPPQLADKHLETKAEPSAWNGFWRAVTKFDKAKITPELAARNTLGVVLPLVAGVALGQVLGGVAMATGALNVSYSDDRGPYRQRGRRMLASASAGAVATFAGASSGATDGLAIMVAGVWAFAVGMLVAVSATAADIGILSLVMVVVFAARHQTLDQAAISALLILAGGLLQTAISLASWPFWRYRPERRVLGELYRELASLSIAPVNPLSAPPASARFTQAQQEVASISRDLSPRGERYLALLHEAERIRLALLVLYRLTRRLERERKPEEPELPPYPSEEISNTLLTIGDSLLTGKLDPSIGGWLHKINDAAESWRQAKKSGDGGSIAAMTRDASFQIDALAGQLRAAAELADHATPEGAQAFTQREERQPWRLRLTGVLATLRANLYPGSAAFRHAVRLAICVGLGEATGRAFGLTRSYWLPMTVAIVLKPDFTTTISRGILRVAGTLLGLSLATALFHLLQPGEWAQLGLLAVSTYILRWIGSANYGIFVTALSAFIVLLLSMTGVTPADVIAARAENTLIGGSLALLAYWIWPTWERNQVGDVLAQMLDAYREYFRAVSKAYLDTGTPNTQELNEIRLKARLARSNAEASVDRLSIEPKSTLPQVIVLDGILAHAHRFIHAVMALEAGLSPGTTQGTNALRTFSNDVEFTLYYLSDCLRRPPQLPAGLPDLRADHCAILHSGSKGDQRYALLTVETDRVTDSLNSLSEMVRKWGATQGAPLETGALVDQTG